MVAEDILREQWRTNYKPAEDDAPSLSVCFSLVVSMRPHTYPSCSSLMTTTISSLTLTTLERLLSEMHLKILSTRRQFLMLMTLSHGGME